MLPACLGLEPTLMAAELSGVPDARIASFPPSHNVRGYLSQPYVLHGRFVVELGSGVWLSVSEAAGVKVWACPPDPREGLGGTMCGAYPSVFRLLIGTGIVDANMNRQGEHQ